MRGLFVDTAGWVACADAADPANRQAAAARDRWLEQGGVLVASDSVADETLTLIRLVSQVADDRRKVEHGRC